MRRSDAGPLFYRNHHGRLPMTLECWFCFDESFNLLLKGKNVIEKGSISLSSIALPRGAMGEGRITMKYITVIVTFFAVPVLSQSLGCIRNASFVGISSSATTWLFNITDCTQCTCLILQTNATAYNCYALGDKNFSCALFQNYSIMGGPVTVSRSNNGSSVCFLQLPPLPSPASQPSSESEVELVMRITSNIRLWSFFSIWLASKPETTAITTQTCMLP